MGEQRLPFCTLPVEDDEFEVLWAAAERMPTQVSEAVDKAQRLWRLASAARKEAELLSNAWALRVLGKEPGGG